jgi:hypothetical protein
MEDKDSIKVAFLHHINHSREDEDSSKDEEAIASCNYEEVVIKLLHTIAFMVVVPNFELLLSYLLFDWLSNGVILIILSFASKS